MTAALEIARRDRPDGMSVSNMLPETSRASTISRLWIGVADGVGVLLGLSVGVLEGVRVGVLLGWSVGVLGGAITGVMLGLAVEVLVGVSLGKDVGGLEGVYVGV